MELRERYKDNPADAAEMMRIYRGKVNPLGGCLPIFADALLHRAVLGAAVQR